MPSLLNANRPPVFCPGCSHSRIAGVLDKAFHRMGLSGEDIVMVSDIGCSGLFDTFFLTHALHGLHGRALTYATGLKLAQPDLNVIVTMGDGGMGIGGAHILSACRRNLDITLLVLNNFNFGMTGGQYSATTPPDATVGSGFLNQIERPLDVGQVSCAAGATYVTRCSAYETNLEEKIADAIQHKGFSVMDIWGVCTGRYTKKNKISPKLIEDELGKLPPLNGVVIENKRKEYLHQYDYFAAKQAQMPSPISIKSELSPLMTRRQEVVVLGSAGQRVITAGDVLCYSGLVAGLNVTQKNEYNITVLTGPSITEVILSPEEIEYTGIEKPTAIVAIGQEGIDRRRRLFSSLDKHTLVIQAQGIKLPPTNAEIIQTTFKKQKIKSSDWALASIATLAKLDKVISLDMLTSGLKARFDGPVLDSSLALIHQIRVDSEKLQPKKVGACSKE